MGIWSTKLFFKWTQLWQESENEPLPMPFQTQVSRPALTAALIDSLERRIS